MSNPSVVKLQLANPIANGICISQAVAAAGNLVINGSLMSGGVATMDVARRVIITSTVNDAAVVFAIFGTNHSGAPISETLTGVTAIPAMSKLDYKTITRVASSAATAGSITVGTISIGSSPWVMDNHLATVWALTVAVSVIGSATFTVEHTYDDPNDIGPTLTEMPEQWSLEPSSYVPPLAWPHPNATTKSTNTEVTYPDQPIMAHRVTITAGSGLVVMQSIQAGIT